MSRVITLFKSSKTASRFYEFHDMGNGETISIPIAKAQERGENLIKARLHIGAHAQYYSKKFKTRIIDNVLYVKRIA